MRHSLPFPLARLSRAWFFVALAAALLAATPQAGAQSITCAVTSTDSGNSGYGSGTTYSGTLSYCAGVGSGNAAVMVDMSGLAPLTTLQPNTTLTTYSTGSITYLGRADGGVTIVAPGNYYLFDGNSSITLDHLVITGSVGHSFVTTLYKTITIKNSTILCNGAVAAASAGGAITLYNSTFSGCYEVAQNAGGGAVAFQHSTVVGSTTGPTGLVIASQSLLDFTTTSQNNPVQDDGTSYLGPAPGLGPLQLNGSLFPTYMLLPGSSAIGTAGNTTFSIDERGFPGKTSGDPGAVQTHYVTVNSADIKDGNGDITTSGDASPADITTGGCVDGSSSGSCTLRQVFNLAKRARVSTSPSHLL